MTGSEWCKEIAKNDQIWYAGVENHYPYIFSQVYSQLHTLAHDGNIYGFFLELRDIYELLIRWYVLTSMAMAHGDDDAETIALLCDPERSFSFGDWVQAFSSCFFRHQKIGNCALGQILKKLNQLYNKGKIVKWRNDSIGHGALQQDTSQAFQQMLEEKLAFLYECLENCSDLAGKIVFTETTDEELYCCVENANQSFPLSLFIRKVGGDYRLFDSITRYDNVCYELSYQTGLRTQIKMPYLAGLRARYYGDVTITNTEILDEEVFTDRVEAALQHYHFTDKYWKQTHYIEWLNETIAEHKKGVFLLQAESGTGKSTFADYLDGFGGAYIAKRGFTCRTYYFSRMSVRTIKDFASTLFELFRQAPEDEGTLLGNLPSLELTLAPDISRHSMAAFLNGFRSIHKRKYGRDKLLLILDGIDELSPQSSGLLHYVPASEQLEDGVYVLVTCRSDLAAGTFQQDFLFQQEFTEKKVFLKKEENEHLLCLAIKESVFLSGRPLDDNQVKRAADILDQRFTGLPVMRAVLECSEDFEASMNAPSILNSYVNLLSRYYGAKHYNRVKTILLTLALAVEPLSLRQLSDLAWDECPTVELLAVMRDLSPLLLSLRDKESTKYILGHPDFCVLLRNDYNNGCTELVLRWRERIAGNPEQIRPEYLWATYIASGMYIWHKDILHEEMLPLMLLENMGNIAEHFSQTSNTELHLQRTARILVGAREGAIEHWQKTGDLYTAAMALGFIAVCIPKTVQLEDMQECAQLERISEKIVGELPADYINNQNIVRALFLNYANRMVMMEKFDDSLSAEKYYNSAANLLSLHPEWIPDVMQVPFIHNAAHSLLHSNPLAALEICNFDLSLSECTGFRRALAMLLKSTALKILNRQSEAGVCIRQAVSIAENETPKLASDVVVYPNALYQLGQHLCIVERDFTQAIQVLTKALSIHELQYRCGALPDRFEAARILSFIGLSYRWLDKDNDQKEQCLWYTNQSLDIHRFAKEKNIQFQAVSAESIFINAACTYHYYGMTNDALNIIDELESMQKSDNQYSQAVLEQCANVRKEIACQ